ncbi:MAG: sulfatase-like hydrolase/transferase [Bacteroidales bacterium]
MTQKLLRNLYIGSLLSCLVLGFAQEKPNIIVILTDDLGYGDLSCNGGKDILTPNIDKMFADGVRFTNFYANCTVSSPTRASLMTGCYPDKVGVPGVIRTYESDNWGFFNPETVTLPDMMKKAGYQTALIGKWHLGLESPGLFGRSSGEEDNRMVYFMRREGGIYGGQCYYAVRKGSYKLLQNTPFENYQLFDIVNDPYEQNPLEQSSEQFQYLKSELAQHIRRTGSIPWQRP